MSARASRRGTPGGPLLGGLVAVALLTPPGSHLLVTVAARAGAAYGNWLAHSISATYDKTMPGAPAAPTVRTTP